MLVVLSEFLDIDFDDNMLTRSSSIYDKVDQVNTMKLRQQQVNRPITYNVNARKNVFDENQASLILERVESLSDRLGYSGRNF